MFRVILHLDMDAFYASVEQRDQPELKGKPVIISSPPSQRGVVSAASYEARTYGVRSAMPSVTAGRLCPDGIFIRPNIEKYKEESRHIMAILRETGARLEPMSIDEAYMDVSDLFQGGDADESLHLALPPGRELKRRIQQERNLTATVGIGPNKMLAKIASDFKKPDGLTLIPETGKALFLRPMPVRVIHGVGRVTEEALARAGIQTIGDVQDFQGDLRAIAGSFAVNLRQYAMGEDDRELETGDVIKSISAEETFLKDTDNRVILKRSLKEQAADLAGKMHKQGLGASTIQVKVRYSDFKTLTRQLSLETPVTEAADIYRIACHLLARERLVSRPLRLIGLGASSLVTEPHRQLRLPLNPGPDRATPR